FIPRGGLHIYLLEASVPLDKSHQQRVQKNSAGETQHARARLLAISLGQLRSSARAGLLHAARQLTLPILARTCDRPSPGVARGIPLDTQPPIEFSGKSDAAGQAAVEEAEIEVRQLTPAATEHLQKNILEIWRALKAEPLRLMLIAVRREAEQVCDLRVYPAERVGKGDGLEHPEPCPLSERQHARAAIPLFIE